MLPPVSIAAWPMLLAALMLAAAAIVLGWRIGLRPAVLALMGIGLGLLALAAGGLTWMRHAPGTVAVLVDLSPSTRGAAYRNPVWLRQRIDQWMGRTPHRIYLFSGRNHLLTTWPIGPLGDLPTDQTRFQPPPDADAILLFSDGRFPLPPSAPPTYIVPDPVLEQAATRDAAVTDLRIEGDHAVATVRGEGKMENGKWKMVNGGRKAGHLPFSIYHFPLSAQPITAHLAHADLWPENNELSITPPVPWAQERWWIGAEPPPGWRVMTPAQLSSEPSAYLRPAVIVLNDLPSAALSPLQMDRLEQYVRDLGGGLLIAGGTHPPGGQAWERLSPLSTDPPRPSRQWIILLDASGSMAAAGGIVDPAAPPETSRWQWAARALHSALPAIPAHDRLTVGGFSDRPHWWSRDLSAQATRALPLPPSDVLPHGPTNLSESLHDLAKMPPANLPAEALILTDAQAPLPDATQLAAQFQARHLRLWVLATGPGEALESLKLIAQMSGGGVLEASAVAQWPSTLRRLAEQARGTRLRHDSIRLQFEGDLQSLGERTLTLWQPAWLKSGAAGWAFIPPLENRQIGSLSHGPSGPPNPESRNPESRTLAAFWHLGSGQVAAATFAPTPAEAQAMARQIAARPADPRLKVTWTPGRTNRLRVDARDENDYLNNLNLTLQLGEATVPIPQSAPGQYETTFPAPRRSVIATVLLDGRPLDHLALPARYAPEFDAVGADPAALAELAQRTGGQFLPARPGDPIPFPRPRRPVNLAPWLATLGALFLAAGLLYWRKT